MWHYVSTASCHSTSGTSASLTHPRNQSQETPYSLSNHFKINTNRTNAAQSQEPRQVYLHCIMQSCPYNCSLWPTWYKTVRSFKGILYKLGWQPCSLAQWVSKRNFFQKEACRIWGTFLLSSWLYSLLSLGLPTPAMRVWDAGRREEERLAAYHEQGWRLPLREQKSRWNESVCVLVALQVLNRLLPVIGYRWASQSIVSSLTTGTRPGLQHPRSVCSARKVFSEPFYKLLQGPRRQQDCMGCCSTASKPVMFCPAAWQHTQPCKSLEPG